MLDYLHDVVKEICIENEIDFEILSKEWIMKLQKGGNLAYIVGYKFSINSDTASRIASDKYATYEVLKKANIPVIEHKMIFNPRIRKNYPSDIKNIRELVQYLIQNQRRIVIKPNDGHGGKGVYLCKSRGEIMTTVKKLFKTKESVSVCPYYDIDIEYRVIMLDGECKLLFGKKKAESEWKCNLNQGASVVTGVDENLRAELIKIAKEAVKVIGIRFASVDIIQTKTRELLIIEVNSGVTIHRYAQIVENGREIAKEIYSEAIKKMLFINDKKD